MHFKSLWQTCFGMAKLLWYSRLRLKAKLQLLRLYRDMHAAAGGPTDVVVQAAGAAGPAKQVMSLWRAPGASQHPGAAELQAQAQKKPLVCMVKDLNPGRWMRQQRHCWTWGWRQQAQQEQQQEARGSLAWVCMQG